MIWRAYELLIVKPLKKLYFTGPAVLQLGFWGGLGPTEICQTLSPLSNTFWQNHPTECFELMERRFEAFRVSLEIFIYFLLLYHLYLGLSNMCVRAFFRRCGRRRPSHVRPLVFYPP